jgi:hypothetical protein
VATISFSPTLRLKPSLILGGGGDGGGGGGGFPLPINPFPGTPQPPLAPSYPVPYTGNIPEWKDINDAPLEVRESFFVETTGYSRSVVSGLPDGNVTTLQLPNTYAGGFTQLEQDLGKLATYAEKVLALIGIGALIGGQRFTAPAQTPGDGSTDKDNITVIVNNQETIGADLLAGLGNAVSGAIGAGVSAAEGFTNSLLDKLKDTLSSVASAIFNTIKDALANVAKNIADVVKAVIEKLPDIIKAIAEEVGKLIKDLKDVLVEILNKIGPVLDKIATTIQNINDTLIQPIATLYNTVIKTISNLTIAIEKDLHSGLSGLLDIPTQIANGMTSLDATMQRTVQQMGTTNKDVWSDIIYKTSDKPVGGSLSGMATSLAGAFSMKSGTTWKPSKETLDNPNLAEVMPKLITAMNNISFDMVKGVWNTLKDPQKAGELMVTVAGGIFFEMFEPMEVFFFLWEVMKRPLEVMSELAAEQVRELIPIEKLPIQNVTAAWRRGYITAEQMDKELAVQGYDANRSKLLRDLTTYLESTNQLADYWFRGIITEQDLNGGLQELGFTDDQIAAFKEGNYRILEPTTAQEALRRGLIDQDAYNLILATNRYTDAQKTLMLDLVYRPATSGEALQGNANRTAVGQFSLASSDFDTPPDWFVFAAKAEGQNDEAIRVNWWSHWNLGTLQTWLQLYFRGIRTRTELEAMMDRYFIPREVHDDFIVSQRPLIPYRSIPSFVKAGFMTDSQGRAELSAHGFDLEHVNIIMSSITPAATKSAATTAQQVKTLSIQNARVLFDDGVLTLADYEAILVQHGYSQELAAAQAQVDQMTAQTKQRKQALNDLLQEVEAGLVTLDDAVTQLNQNGFTSVEISRFQNTIRRSQAKGAKHPSIGLLKAFFKAQVITQKQFSDELQAQGWGEPWLSAILGLDSLPDGSLTATGGSV